MAIACIAVISKEVKTCIYVCVVMLCTILYQFYASVSDYFNNSLTILLHAIGICFSPCYLNREVASAKATPCTRLFVYKIVYWEFDVLSSMLSTSAN